MANMNIRRLLLLLAIVIVALTCLLVVNRRQQTITSPPLFSDDYDIEVFGELDYIAKYAVVSTSSDKSANDIFLLPLTVLAWKRIGYNSVVIVVGSVDVWNSEPLLYHVLSSLRRLGAVVVFIKAPPQHSAVMTHVSRIFAGDILREWFAVDKAAVDDIFLLSTYTDTWPINRLMYQLPSDTDFVSLNTFCCGAIKHDHVNNRMLIARNIAMRVGTWSQVNGLSNNMSELSVSDILLHVARVFGDLATKPVSKIENAVWYFDHAHVSVVIKHRMHGAFKYIERNIAADRIDRNCQSLDHEVLNNADALLLVDLQKPSVTSNLTPLLRAMYDNTPGALNWSITYQESFWRLRSEERMTFTHQSG